MTSGSLSQRVARKAGTLLLRKGRCRSAVFLLSRAVRLGPGDWEAHNNLAIALLKLQRWEEAASMSQRAVKLNPGAVEPHDSLGIALLQLARWEEAVAVYRRAIGVDPARYLLYERLAMALSRLERWDEAVEAYEALLQLEAGHRVAHQRLGEARLRLGHWNAAAAALRRAITLAANDPAAASELAGMQTHLTAAEAQIDAARSRGTVPERLRQRQAAFWTVENLGADVFAVERWLEELSVVAEHVPPGPRLLFVLDHDFGELATVKFFVLGQDLAGRSTLLLPDRLYVHNVDAIPGRTHQYGSVDDVLAAVDREQAQVVFLCAGYLLTEHLGFTADELTRLVGALRQRGCRVVTADPFLGMLSKQDPRTLIRVDIPTDHPHFTVEQLTEAKRPAEERLQAGYAASERILRDMYHLYPSYCDVAEDDAAETDARNLSFFNDRLLRPPRVDGGAVSPHWLFILGTPDCEIQELFERESFLDIVARKLLETRAAGRHPVLIGPRAFVDQLVARMPTAEGVDILSQCPFTQFYALLLSAEQAFYWNVVSHSLLIRLYNQLPIIQFDHGHLIRTAPGIYDRIVAWYYQGWAPPLRNHHEPLTLETVERWTAEYRPHAARLVERYRRAAAPEQLIAALMDRALTPGLEAKAAAR